MNLYRLTRKLFRVYTTLKKEVNQRLINQGKYYLKTLTHSIYITTEGLIPLICLTAFGLVTNDMGFNPFYSHHKITNQLLTLCLLFLIIALVARFMSEWFEKKKAITLIYNFLMLSLTIYLYRIVLNIELLEPERESPFFWKKIVLYGGIIMLFLAEISGFLRFFRTKKLNPSFLFLIGFAGIIIFGGLLLMLPNSTVNGISPLDALFTSASSVCVTGLIVVDTATTFTTLGKTFILFLIQIGGLGIMTFTALLSYLAAGSVSFQSQLALKDMLYSNRMNNVIQLITRILVVTFFFEFIGVVLIHYSIGDSLHQSEWQEIFFSIFHSISAFCNAGFSTLSQGLYEAPIRYNYTLHLIIAFLIILGGMGFPIVFNLFTLIKIKTTNIARRILKEPKMETNARILQMSSRLAITSSTILLALGLCTFLIFEREHTLLAHPSDWGKFITAFFASVTPRTAGFNTVEVTAMSLPTVMIYLLLMWIGASPGSTGGGIKTTTASVAVLNVISVIRGKSRTEVFQKQISEKSISKAFAIILISLLILGLAITLIALNDGDKGLLRIAFEVFSAFSTVGLTLGLTADLSPMSKIVLIIVMFIGRVGALTIFIAFIQQQKQQLYYKYPTEEVMF